jgi:hypothetical protein
MAKPFISVFVRHGAPLGRQGVLVCSGLVTGAVFSVFSRDGRIARCFGTRGRCLRDMLDRLGELLNGWFGRHSVLGIPVDWRLRLCVRY